MTVKEIYARIEAINTSDNQLNLDVLTLEGNRTNIKANINLRNELIIKSIYKFKVAIKEDSVRQTTNILSFSNIADESYEKLDEIYRAFFPASTHTLKELELRFKKYIKAIDNKIIREITEVIIKDNKEKFFIYPAASKLHHNYVGGLAHHTLSMLGIADGFLKIYPFLNKDYLYAGIILHDIGKTSEFSGVENTEYTIEGQLLGHLIIGANLIDAVATKLNYGNTEEALLLKHSIISHHGQPMYGSAKKPMTSEALLTWYIDTIDSKFVCLEDELAKVEEGAFTEQIAVLDRVRFYKPKNN